MRSDADLIIRTAQTQDGTYLSRKDPFRTILHDEHNLRTLPFPLSLSFSWFTLKMKKEIKGKSVSRSHHDELLNDRREWVP